MFENGMFDFFNGRRALEDPRKKVVLSRREYEKLLESSNSFEILAEKYKEATQENQELKQELQMLKKEFEQSEVLKEENKALMNSLVRTKADLENYRKLADREKTKYRLQATASILRKIISHHDDLVRSVKTLDSIENGDHIKKGLEMVIKNLEKVLAEENVVPMKCKGKKFDPYKHEAIMVKEDNDFPENTILENLDEGYFYNNEVLRPARVIISKKTQ